MIETIHGKVRFGGIRRIIARRMQESLQTTAQLTYHATADVTAIDRLLLGWKAAGKPYGLQDCLIYSMCRALAINPQLNGTADPDGYRLDNTIDLSIALSTRVGLVTPVLRGIENLDLETLARRRRELTARALNGELQVSQMGGGTFTLSNLGLTAVEYFTPILNAPQIAILGVGRSRQVPAFGDAGEVVARKMLPLSLTADHRVVDGEPAGQFLTDLVAILRETDWADLG